MYEKEKQEVLDCALKIKRYGLISLTGGNVSWRMPDGTILVTPSGMDYEEITYEDIVLVSAKGEVIEGRRKPSSDLPALLYIFEKKPKVNAIIHTHQPYATALGLVRDRIPLSLVTIIDACHYEVNVAPYTPSSALGMGIVTVDYIGESLAVILKHHGVVAVGADIKEALYSAVYLEESAKTLAIAASIGEIPELTEVDIQKESEGWKTYGQ